MLTNAAEATDVAAVHAGYAKRRKPLLKAGITLFEMKRAAPSGRGMRWRGKGSVKGSSSRSSLHAKTFSVDRARVYVGSFNFDPRSARLNTELGFVIESAALAERIADAFVDDIHERGYRLQLSKAGRLQWLERIEGRHVTHESEPGMNFWLRVTIAIVSRLPVEWLL